MINSISIIFPLYNEEKRLNMCFKDIIESHYKANRDNIISELNTCIYDKGINDLQLYVSVYRINIKLAYIKLKEIIISNEKKL